MVTTDPITDSLTHIRNTNAIRYEVVEVPSPNTKRTVADILLQEGYIKELEEHDDDVVPVLGMSLRYGADKERVITGIERASKPGLRVYCKKDEIPKVLSGLGIVIISISTGLLVDRGVGKAGLDREVVCYV